MKRLFQAAACCFGLVLASQQFAQAVPVLTAAGIADGFVLTTFATIDPGNTGCCSGPFGIAMGSNGDVLVHNNLDSRTYFFADTDGQTLATTLSSTPNNSNTAGYVTVGGVPYGETSQPGSFVQFNNDGTVNRILTGVSAQAIFGMWANPVNGHIIASSSAGLIDVDPLANGGAGSFRVINASLIGADGVTGTADGTTAYVENLDVIQSYDIATGHLIATYNTSGQPDGTGIINGGALNGFVIVNTNLGNIDLIDPVAHTFVTIATGGTRGDYIAPDVTNGSFFLDYSDVVMRLSCGAGCTIGTTAAKPEPSTNFLSGTALALLFGSGVRRFRRV
jgi:hypothetical protein